MFRKNTHNSQEKPAETEGQQKSAAAKSEKLEASSPRYPKPKVLLVDLKDDSEGVLRASGYNVHVGTLGTPYPVPKSSSYRLVARGFKIPNYREQEIVVIDLAANSTLNEAPETEEAVKDSYDYWGKCNHGVIDPRPVASKLFRDPFDLIRAHGGIFIIFADYPKRGEIKLALNTSHGLDVSGQDLELWSFLTPLASDRFRVDSSQGREIQVIDTSIAIGKLIRRYLNNAQYTCIFGPRQYTPHGEYNADCRSWIGLATDKYDYFVGGMFPAHDDVKGLILLLPQIARKSGFLADLFRDILPELLPELFPYAEGRTWIDKDEYQVPEVVELRREVSHIQAEADERIREIERRIVVVKEQNSYLRQLLTETGDVLVGAVKETLEQLGFTSVVDVDEETKNSREQSIKREDLRVIESPLTLLIEVKGITGLPADEDALQVHKYIPVRMREWKHTNVQGLAIINHQKGLPPLGREHQNTFRRDILVNAEEQQFGLMTTWDLFRLARSFKKLGWQPETLKPLFFKPGRIEPVPVHYEFVGTVEHFWDNIGVVGVRLQVGGLTEGDRIAFELPIEFEEQTVGSLQVNNEQVQVAKIPELVGIKTDLKKLVLKNGIRVYRLNS